MRLWSLHPKYLDSRGLVALWREALLAQAVLGGKTRGYVHHPQLIRFRESPVPLASIGHYLQVVHEESLHRGYRFDATKIIVSGTVTPIATTQGQLDYEWQHLKLKLQSRDPSWLARFQHLSSPEPHPAFLIVPGEIAEWEIT